MDYNQLMQHNWHTLDMSHLNIMANGMETWCKGSKISIITHLKWDMTISLKRYHNLDLDRLKSKRELHQLWNMLMIMIMGMRNEKSKSEILYNILFRYIYNLFKIAYNECNNLTKNQNLLIIYNLYNFIYIFS